MDLARAIRMARAARGLSQRELAKQVGVRPNYVSMLERGQRSNPSATVVAKFARALNLPVPLLTLLGADAAELRLISEKDANRLARALLDALTENELQAR